MTMTGKDLIFAALQHQPTERTPWLPFAGVHVGSLKGYTAEEVLKDGDKLFESLLEAHRLYSPDGQPVLFDLQIEAEILGCELLWAEKAPPSVASHPLAGDFGVPDKLPEASDGRLPVVLDVMARMKEAVGETTALYGLICGPFTLASHLRGTEIFLDMMMQPDKVVGLLAYTRQVALRMADLYIEAGMDVIAVVDPLVSQIGPHHFEQFLKTDFTQIFAHLRERGVYSSFFVCGDATKNIEGMCQTSPDSLGIDENIDLASAKAITDRYNVTLGGNIPLTTVMLLGSQQDNMQFALDLLDNLDTHNFILAPGCDMPYDIPVENVVGVVEAVREPEKVRQMLANYETADQFDIEVELPDYDHLAKPLIEVFTIDSDTCAACTYMFGVATRAATELGTQVDVVEYKFTQRENIARAKKMGIEKLPAIYINGQLKYSSIIPSTDALLDDVRALL